VRHPPPVALFGVVRPELAQTVELEEDFEVLAESLAEGGAEAAGPDLEVGDLLPGQQLPRGQVNHDQVGVHEDQGQHEDEEDGHDEEDEQQQHLLPIVQLQVLGAVAGELDLEAEEEGRSELQELEVDEPEEPELVALAHAVPDPGAVVVVRRHALVAVLAVLAPQGLLDVADGAVLVLYEEDEVVLAVLLAQVLLVSHVSIPLEATELTVLALVGRVARVFYFNLDLDVILLQRLGAWLSLGVMDL